MLRDMLAEETGEAVYALRGVVDAAELRPIDLSAIVRTGSSTGAETGLDVPTPLARHPDEELRRLAIDVAARHALRSETSLLGTVRRGRVALARGEFCEEALRGGRHSLREVARFLGRSASTVSELARRGRIVKAASRNGGRSEPSPP